MKTITRPSATLWITALSVLLLGGWAAVAEIEQVTRAQGQIIASSRTQIIQSLDGGVLQEMPVREGDRVARGQLLARLDGTKVEAGYKEARAKKSALLAARARLEAEIRGGAPAFPEELRSYPQFVQNQRELMRKRVTAIQEELKALKDVRELARKELEMTQPLLKTGDVSMAEVLRLQRQVADIQSQITNRQNKYFQDTQAELSKVEEELAGVEQNLLQRRDQLDRIEIRSPANGIVKNVRVTTLGGVLRPGEEVMQIVPVEDDMLVEVKVRPSDIAFLKPGLYANVKIDAYDYTIYGALDGRVSYISADTLTEDLRQGEQAYYRVQIKVEGRRFAGRPGELIELQPGMTVTAEIITGKNTVLRYLLKPVVKTITESMGER